MESLRKLYKVGPGPSSSHTIGPKRICEAFIKEYSDSYKYVVDLYGSLTLTGKGHLTDFIINKTFKERNLTINFNQEFINEHPNTMDLTAYDENDNPVGFKRAYSVGGGDYVFADQIINEEVKEVYPHNSMAEIIKYVKDEKISLSDYVYRFEDENIKEFLISILNTMFESVKRGLSTTGRLPGSLKLDRVAAQIYKHIDEVSDQGEKDKLLLSAYAYAVSEENASGGEVVTAPTCGSSGVIPAVLYYFYTKHNTPVEKLADALAVAGVIGNLVKKNATISGAIGGCQAEIGTACCMAASAIAYLFDLDVERIEYAAEVGMEHHLGLTCDPVKGYVQIPCIERNGVAALRAYDSALYAKHIGAFRKNKVTLDQVIETMRSTGHDLNYQYKETALGGLAKYVKDEEA